MKKETIELIEKLLDKHVSEANRELIITDVASLEEEVFNVGQPTQKIDPEFSYFLIGEPDRHHRVYDSDKLRKEIGNYARWPLVRGLGATLQWYHATGELSALLASIQVQQGGQLCMSH